MKCPHCKQEHRDDALFCENTGKKIEGQLKACTNQGCQSFGKYILPKEAAFCPSCGQKIKASHIGNSSAQNAVNKLHQSPVSKPSPASKPVEPEVVDLFQLGFNYENGRGVTKDLNLALKYYTQAANYGHQRAINALERLSLYGTNKIRLSRNEIANRVRKIIVEKMGVADCEVIDSAYFIYDLGADSLDSVELIIEFEKEFNIEILDEEISDNINTVGDAIDFIQMKINGFR